MDKKWTFRKLNAKDLMPLATIIDTLGVKDLTKALGKDNLLEITRAFSGEETSDEQNAYMMVNIALTIASVICANFEKCGDKIYTLLASTSNLSKKEIESLSLEEITTMIIDFVKLDDFMGFFKASSLLFK